MSVRVLAATGAAILLLMAGCGTSGTPLTRPIETLVYVSGGPGVEFIFNDVEDLEGCGSNTTGLQSANASHQFVAPGDPPRVFTTPHLFVLENDRQPVRAAIRNISNAPIRVDLYLGQTPQQSNVVINAGECRTVSQIGSFPPTPSGVGPTPTAVTFATPNTSGPEIQVEVCSPLNSEGDADLRIPCVRTPEPSGTPGPSPTATPGDRNIAYFATIGDIQASNISNCLLPPILDACRSPSTIFIEQPQEQVDAIMSVNPGQNPGNGLPPAEVRAEMYVDGNRVDSAAGTNPVVSFEL